MVDANQYDEFSDLVKTVESLERKFNSMTRNIYSRVDKYRKKKQDVTKLQARLLEKNGGMNVNEAEILKLNVGGEIIKVNRNVLTQVKGSRLEIMFSGRWENQLLRDENGMIFLDIDPYCFKKIIEYLMKLMMSKMWEGNKELDLPKVDEDHENRFRILFTYFGLDKNNHQSTDSTTTNQSPIDENDKISMEKIYDDLNKFNKQVEERIRISEEKLTEISETTNVEDSLIKYLIKNKDEVNDEIVNFSVIGKSMASKRSTLYQFPDSVFGKKFVKKDIIVEFEKSSVYNHLSLIEFLEMYEKVVDALRLRVLRKEDEILDEMDMKPLLSLQNRELFENHFSKKEIIQIFQMIFTESTIVSDNDSSHVMTWLESVGHFSEPKLLYRASRDGWSSTYFHIKCDNQGPTLTVIKTTEGYIFGGYLDKSWHSKDQWITSEKAFLFSLKCYADLPPTKFDIKEDQYQYAANGHSNHGPRFGGGTDIFISSNPNENDSSYVNPSSYTYPSDVDKSTFLVGSRNFRVSELEVFSVN